MMMRTGFITTELIELGTAPTLRNQLVSPQEIEEITALLGKMSRNTQHVSAVGRLRRRALDLG